MKKTVIAVIAGLTLVSPAMANKGRLESAVSPIEAFNTGFNNAINNYNSMFKQRKSLVELKIEYAEKLYSACLKSVYIDDKVIQEGICACFTFNLYENPTADEDLINKTLDSCIERYSK